MAASLFERFLSEATVPDPNHHLGIEELFGLYISWCHVQQQDPDSERDFRTAMKKHGIDASATGLRKTGPAATDYILASYPALP